jgi:hypothetical protein
MKTYSLKVIGGQNLCCNELLKPVTPITTHKMLLVVFLETKLIKANFQDPAGEEDFLFVQLQSQHNKPDCY